MGDDRRQVGHPALEHTDRRREREAPDVRTEHRQAALGYLVLGDLITCVRVHPDEDDPPTGGDGLEPGPNSDPTASTTTSAPRGTLTDAARTLRRQCDLRRTERDVASARRRLQNHVG